MLSTEAGQASDRHATHGLKMPCHEPSDGTYILQRNILFEVGISGISYRIVLQVPTLTLVLAFPFKF